VSPFLVGLLAGLLPLIHLHSLVVLFVVGTVLFILRPERWMTWIAFAIGVGLIAVPELAWSASGSASETSKFFEWHFGWDKGDKNFLSFWFLNTGLVIPLIIAGLLLVWFRRQPVMEFPQSRKAAKKKSSPPDVSTLPTHISPLIFFYIPFAFLFLVSNAAKLAPWEWDNIKVLIYWFVGSLPFIALAISWAWDKQRRVKTAAAICFVRVDRVGRARCMADRIGPDQLQSFRQGRGRDRGADPDSDAGKGAVPERTDIQHRRRVERAGSR
jgi:hypothetical protein